jgi:peroxiredoxin/outer membrane lipoprotein-sorting protein
MSKACLRVGRVLAILGLVVACGVVSHAPAGSAPAIPAQAQIERTPGTSPGAAVAHDSATVSDPAAVALYERMMTTIRDAQSLSWESAYQFAFGENLGRPSVLRFWMKKPGYARVEAIQEGKLSGVMVGDGRCFWIYWPEGRPRWEAPDSSAWPARNQYLQDLIPANRYSIAHRANLLAEGVVMLAFEPTVFHGMPDMLSRSTQSMRVAGSEAIDGEPCDILEILMMDGQRSRSLWISRRDQLPRKILEVAHLKADASVTEVWSNVRRNPRVPDKSFQWTPPDGWTQYYEADLNAGLLPAGSPAPDFDLPLDGGGRFRLSAMRGKLVLMSFWRTGCPPCRDEVSFLQEIYTTLATEGFVVVGINTADDPERSRGFLGKCRATFPAVIDTSAAAQAVQTFYQTLPGRTAVPLSYLIDAQGNVVEAWYGFDKEAHPTWIRGELARLGIR